MSERGMGGAIILFLNVSTKQKDLDNANGYLLPLSNFRAKTV